jgi:antirestriction protein ArdC
MQNLYKTVTEKLIAMMERGVIPWRRPWGNRSIGSPTNLMTHRKYRGINVLRLMSECRSAWWATASQIAALGGKLRTDAKPIEVIGMFSFLNSKDEETFRCTSSIVYNLDDTEHLCAPHSKIRNKLTPIAACERFLWNMPTNMPRVIHGGRTASYNWFKDLIKMPPMESFDSIEQYYATLFHEYAHSTGHATRLNREIPMDRDDIYAFEELIAELTSAFVCAQLGIDQMILERAAYYVNGWLKPLKKDHKKLIFAAAHAQKAADYMQKKKLLLVG